MFELYVSLIVEPESKTEVADEESRTEVADQEDEERTKSEVPDKVADPGEFFQISISISKTSPYLSEYGTGKLETGPPVIFAFRHTGPAIILNVK